MTTRHADQVTLSDLIRLRKENEELRSRLDAMHSLLITCEGMLESYQRGMKNLYLNNARERQRTEGDGKAE